MTFGALDWSGDVQTIVKIAPGFGPEDDPNTYVFIDITKWIRGAVTIGKARRSPLNTGDADPTQVDFTIVNNDGRFSHDNPMGPYWPGLTIGTPIQISRTWTGATDTYERATVFATQWPTLPTAGIEDVVVPMHGEGRLRTLRRDGATVISPMTGITPATNPIAWWPLEQGGKAVMAASGLHGGLPMRSAGHVVYDSGTGAPGTLPLADLSESGLLTASISTSSTEYEIGFVFGADEVTAGNPGQVIFKWTTPNGGVDFWQLTVLNVADGGFTVSYSIGGVLTDYNTGFLTDDGDGTKFHHVFCSLRKAGSSTTFDVYLDGVDVASDTIAHSYSPLNAVYANPTRSIIGMGFGQLAVWAPYVSSIDMYNAFLAFPGEKATDRVQRVCDQANIPVEVIAGVIDAQLMGPQLIDTPSNILSDCVKVDLGLLHDGGTLGALVYVSGAARYNAPVAFELDFNGEIDTSFAGAYDDTNLVTQWTVTPVDGSPSTFRDPTLSNIDYGEGGTFNVASDVQAYQLAAWKTHLDSYDATKFDSLIINLRRAPHLAEAITSMVLPARISPVNVPAPPYPFDSFDQFAEGYLEICNAVTWIITANTTPYQPWEGYVVGDSILGRYDTGGSSLHQDYSATATSWLVDVAALPLWGTSAAFPSGFPFDLMVDGERVTCTAISGTSSPQTFTVKRSVNGVVKKLTAGTAVGLFRPAVLLL